MQVIIYCVKTFISNAIINRGWFSKGELGIALQQFRLLMAFSKFIMGTIMTVVMLEYF